ncbi:MAG TPA: hypothetical protein VII26_02930 [Candidatus Limnocylindria bacterium]
MVGGRIETWAAGAGVATLIVALVWRAVIQEWAMGDGPSRYDMFEPFLRPWEGLTWITQGVLWPAFLFRRWPWIPLVAVAVGAVAIQAWMGAGSAWVGVSDGEVSPLGAVMGALSIAQLGLTVVWMVLLARSKRVATSAG